MSRKLIWTHIASYQRCAGYHNGKRCDFVFEFKGGCSPGCPCYCEDCSKRLEMVADHRIVRINTDET